MYRVIALVAVFLVIFYIITFVKMYKKKKAEEKAQSKGTYKRKLVKRIKRRSRISNDTDHLFDRVDKTDERIDYITKDDLYKEVRESANSIL